MPSIKTPESDMLYRLLKPVLHLPDHCLGFTLEVEYLKPVILTTKSLVTYEEEDQEVVTETKEVHLEEEAPSDSQEELR